MLSRATKQIIAEQEARDATDCAFCKRELASGEARVPFFVYGSARKKLNLLACLGCAGIAVEHMWEARRSLDYAERRSRRGGRGEQ